jgi:hypothetical protein
MLRTISSMIALFGVIVATPAVAEVSIVVDKTS